MDSETEAKIDEVEVIRDKMKAASAANLNGEEFYEVMEHSETALNNISGVHPLLLEKKRLAYMELKKHNSDYIKANPRAHKFRRSLSQSPAANKTIAEVISAISNGDVVLPELTQSEDLATVHHLKTELADLETRLDAGEDPVRLEKELAGIQQRTRAINTNNTDVNISKMNLSANIMKTARKLKQQRSAAENSASQHQVSEEDQSFNKIDKVRKEIAVLTTSIKSIDISAVGCYALLTKLGEIKGSLQEIHGNQSTHTSKLEAFKEISSLENLIEQKLQSSENDEVTESEEIIQDNAPQQDVTETDRTSAEQFQSTRSSFEVSSPMYGKSFANFTKELIEETDPPPPVSKTYEYRETALSPTTGTTPFTDTYIGLASAQPYKTPVRVSSESKKLKRASNIPVLDEKQQVLSKISDMRFEIAELTFLYKKGDVRNYVAKPKLKDLRNRLEAIASDDSDIAFAKDGTLKDLGDLEAVIFKGN